MDLAKGAGIAHGELDTTSSKFTEQEEAELRTWL
jgi:hypothetical protein